MTEDPRLTPRAMLFETLAAARFAAEKHSGQRRKGAIAEPYINHPIEVALLLTELPARFDRETVIAGLLHDLIEDTDVTPDELAERFGTEVASLVLEVTDDKSLEKHARKALQVESAPAKSPRAQNLSTADKISNLRSTLSNPPSDWTLQRRREYFDWAKAVVDRFGSVDAQLKAEFDSTYSQFEQAGEWLSTGAGRAGGELEHFAQP